MSSQICLKWNSFLNNIATSFESLWEEEGLVDVTLASDGQCLTAHKVILSASSPFFKKVFQTNPCQHPVIILQDVHFSELEALLIFIYKGEVNIEQKNLPALLKAAETLQIRGLSGGDIFAKESYKRLIESEQTVEDDDDHNSTTEIIEETPNPKKKQKVIKSPSDSILEKALTPKVTSGARSQTVSESSSCEPILKDPDGLQENEEPLPNPVYHRLEMKIEPFEVTVEDLQKDPLDEKNLLTRIDTGQVDETQVDLPLAGSSKPTITVIAEAREICRPQKPPAVHDPISTPEIPTEIPSKTVDDSSRKGTESNDTSLIFPEDFNNLGSQSFSTHPPEITDSSQSLSIAGTATTTATATRAKGGTATYPPFPCPFCDRAYTSWGFRRRHIKAVHTISPRLNCKWCPQVLPTHAAWRRHVIYAHNLSASDAHNGLLILEEAHMVLQISHPTRLDTLVNIIKQNSQQNLQDSSTQPD